MKSVIKLQQTIIFSFIGLVAMLIGTTMICFVEVIKYLRKCLGKLFINPQIGNKSLDRSNNREIHSLC